MYNLILACLGIALAAAGGIYLAKLMYLKKCGVIAKAEVLSAKETITKKGKSTNSYVHTLQYTVNGRTYNEDDKAGYSQPLKEGSTHLILCDPRDPKRFKFEADVQKHITIAAVFAAMGLVFAARFLYSYIK